MAQKISIIIPTNGRTVCLKRLLDSLKKSVYKDMEIIVVNDGGNLDRQELKNYDLVFINNSSNQGMAFSRNQGAKMARGEYVLFIDDDNVVEENMIPRLIKSLDDHQDLIAVGPVTYYLSAPEKIWFIGSNFNLTTSKPFFHKKPLEKQLLDKELFAVGNLHNCFMIRKNIARQAEWFDEKMAMSGTEFDLFMRMKKLNRKYSLAINLNASCYHDIPPREKDLFRSLGFNYPKRAYFFQRNRAILVAKHGNICQKLLFAFIFYPIFLFGYSLFFIVRRRFDFLQNHLKATLDGYHYLLKQS
ncbi:glycosyltransferase [Candidatus Parcubacteria bacterium]|nr:glycosyltransferase [Candidatus Parcubacteria bacterium]